ncbi:hypothetical protein F5J12DRAFT_856004 [Pisolithus orientalis]|uniref:uncharacterized protein n=1 Tax=Pisolithus orientalis TaxID=936130 RepID=UPI00222483FD|nr:uncharacterized protein F5J12DRAFT_856004 [Pisolithus orientalis]KAI5995312.1 hypothetical protein F5J12DRAFT_856004 [Pisolithus orientalis]
MSICKENFFSRLFRRIFGMNPPPLNPPTIYGLFTALNDCLPETQNTYRWEAYMTDREFPDSSLCFVDKVTWHKSYSMDQHEFLRFEIKAPDGPHRAIVVVDRTVDISSIAKMSAVALTSSGCCTSSRAFTQAAVDQVTAATMGTPWGDKLMDNHNCSLVSTLTFSTCAPSADELSTLLALISEYRETYHLIDSQCFWYAKTAFKALVELFNGSENPADEDHGGGKIHGSKLPLPGDVHHICRIYKERREALPPHSDRLRKGHADTTMQVDLQGSREDADRCEEEAENHLQVLEAKVSELEAKLEAKNRELEAKNRERQQALLASENREQQLLLEMQVLRIQLARAAEKA